MFGWTEQKEIRTVYVCVCVCVLLFLFFYSLSAFVDRTQLLCYAKVRYNSLVMLTGFHWSLLTS